MTKAHTQKHKKSLLSKWQNISSCTIFIRFSATGSNVTEVIYERWIPVGGLRFIFRRLLKSTSIWYAIDWSPCKVLKQGISKFARSRMLCRYLWLLSWKMLMRNKFCQASAFRYIEKSRKLQKLVKRTVLEYERCTECLRLFLLLFVVIVILFPCFV